MDYKYIEQLLERYWQCETSTEEEAILSAFFSQKNIPAELEKYRDLFTYEQLEKSENHLGNDFDEKMLAMVGDESRSIDEKVRKIQLRWMPLFRAAAMVAIIVTLTNALQFSMSDNNSDEIDYANYMDTYQDPVTAYDKMEDALQLVSEGMVLAMNTDSLSSQQSDSISVK